MPSNNHGCGMRPFWKATVLVRINYDQVVPTSPRRYYWEIFGMNQLQRTYIEKDCAVINLRQKGSSPTPQHSYGMFQRFCKMNGISKFKMMPCKKE